MADLDLRYYTREDLPEIRQTIIDIHRDAQGEQIDDFRKKFAWYVDHWGSREGYSCVIAYDGDTAAGFSYGAPAVEGREWWREYVDPAPEKAVTFAFSELAVRQAYRKQGLADQLTRALLEDRGEDLAVLLVDVEHPRVQGLYEEWGFRKVGEQRSAPDSPVFAVMLAELPLKKDQ
ncbi:GNAT family N-acetyltransferase [Streptomyces sp. NPDC020707]|uniref:GNAT family N-acetyltransferase n=1 Tax=Streptomyces sp. NPDC020707 TaxID=3365084 RepID=UPI003794FDEE